MRQSILRPALPVFLVVFALLSLLLPDASLRALADGGGGGSPGASPGSSPGASSPPAKLTGQYAEFCSCERICESILLEPNHRGSCASVCVLKIEAGQRGDVSLAGVSAAIVAPDPASSGAGKAAVAPILYVDHGASSQQVDALRSLLAERFAVRFGLTPTTQTKPATIRLNRSTETVQIEVEGVADMRARPISGGYRRTVQIENAPNGVIAFPSLGRGTAGQVNDPAAHVRFDAEGHSVLYGKFDFGAVRQRK